MGAIGPEFANAKETCGKAIASVMALREFASQSRTW
jgi:hypothetical protein